MKRKFAFVLIAACVLTACGSKPNIVTGNKELEDAVYNNEYVSLAPYTGLKAEKKKYIVTQKAVDAMIHDQLSEYAEYNSVDRASAAGDWVSTSFTAESDGTVFMQEEDYFFILGEEEYGAEFDKQLTGVTTGDQLSFTIDYDSDFSDMDLAGKTVDFEVNVTDVREEIMPDTDDAFIKEHTSYDTYQQFEEAVRKSIEDSYESESTSELQEELLRKVVESSSILQYSRKEYDTAREEYEGSCLEMFEMFDMNLDEIYEALEMSKEDVEEDITYSVFRTIVIDAILDNENMSLSDDEYEEGIAYYMEENDYDSRSEFINDYGEDEIRGQLLEDKVLDYLTVHADLTEVEAEYEN